MGLISFGGPNKAEKPIESTPVAEVIKPQEIIEPQESQFFGIVNMGSKTSVLVGPFGSFDNAFSALKQSVDKLMSNPATELIVGEDSAAVYEKTEKGLSIVKAMDIYAMLEECEDE